MSLHVFYFECLLTTVECLYWYLGCRTRWQCEEAKQEGRVFLH